MQVKGYIYGIAHEHIDTVLLDFFHTRLVHVQQGTKGPFSLANTNRLMAITTTWDALPPCVHMVEVATQITMAASLPWSQASYIH